MNSSACIPIISDVTSDDFQEDVHRTLSEATAIDVLINNAGFGGQAQPFVETDIDEVRRFIDVHCLGDVRVTQTVIPFMKDKAP